jgi:hypothetical protein
MKPTLSFLLLTAFAIPASGQIFVQNMNGGNPANQTASQKKRLEREIAFLIGDMKRICKLTEQQERKLKLAGKGAVASAMEKFEKQQKQMRQAMQRAGVALPFPAGNDATDDDEEQEEERVEGELEIEDVIEAPGPAAFAGMINVMNLQLGPGGTTTRGTVTTEARWTKAIETIVSTEQRAAYAAAVKERAAFARKSAVAAFIAKVDQKLLLSKDQRTKLTTMVDDNFGKELAARVGQDNQGTRWFAAVGGVRQTPPIAYQELKPLLSEPQLAEWKASFESELRRLQPGMGAAGGFGGVGNIRINAAPAGAAIRIERLVPADEDKDEDDN